MDIFSSAKEISDKIESLGIKENPLDVYRHLEQEMQELKAADGDLHSVFELVDISLLAIRLIYSMGFDAEEIAKEKIGLVVNRLDMAHLMKNTQLKTEPNKKIDGINLYKKAKNKIG